ncbi:MAG: hypothetical protein H7039_02745 [Bryobacteraceae bacterium]|nr:hypothetical protein [Bryobacteraceae bacterium]
MKIPVSFLHTSPAAICLAITVSCAFAQNTSYENLNAVLWMQTSQEYRAAALGTYRNAEASLMRGLSDRTWTAALEQTQPASELPPAVILDLDETVLDNSALQAQLTASKGTYDEKVWNSWVAKVQAGLVPGAAEFLAQAQAHGVSLFYVTNRVCDAKNPADPTVLVLRKHNLPFHMDRLLCRSDNGDKSPRRAYVGRGHRVILLIGDDYNDFVIADRSLEARSQAVLPYERYWGERWFLLPNPTYGSWERAVGYKVAEKLEKLRK